jgi:acyl carrier protein
MQETEIKEKLRKFICTILLTDPNFPLKDDTSLIKGGVLDSYSALEVALFSEETFRVALSDDHFGKVDTVNDIAKIVLEATKG